MRPTVHTSTLSPTAALATLIPWRTVIAWVTLFVFFLALPVLLVAQVDTTATDPDRLGLFGPLLDQFWPMIDAALASATVWAIRQGTALMRTWPAPAIWAVLYGLNLLYNIVARLLGIVEIDPVAHTWTDGAALAAVQTFAAALPYYFGRHKVPTPVVAR